MKRTRKTEVKVGLNGYYKPTPSKWRKIGDGLLIFSTALATLNINHPTFAIAIQFTGVLGKFLTNLTYQED